MAPWLLRRCASTRGGWLELAQSAARGKTSIAIAPSSRRRLRSSFPRVSVPWARSRDAAFSVSARCSGLDHRHAALPWCPGGLRRPSARLCGPDAARERPDLQGQRPVVPVLDEPPLGADAEDAGPHAGGPGHHNRARPQPALPDCIRYSFGAYVHSDTELSWLGEAIAGGSDRTYRDVGIWCQYSTCSTGQSRRWYRAPCR